MFHALLNPVTVVLPSGGYESFLLGNLLAGLVEYGVLRWRFGLQGFRWLVILVVVNACSAAIGGYPLQTWLPTWISRLNLGPLDQVPMLLLSAALLTFLLALLLELPAYFAIFRLADVRRRQPIRALLVAHLVSWPVTLGLAVFLSRHEWDLSLYSRTQRVRVSAIAPPRTWVWFLRDGKLCKQRLGSQAVEFIPVSFGEAETIASDPALGGWVLEEYVFDTPNHCNSTAVLLAPSSWVGPMWTQSFPGKSEENPWKDKFLNISILREENYFNAKDADRRAVTVSPEGMGSVRVLQTGGPSEVLRAFSPFHRPWFGRAVTFPEGQVLFEMDQGMALLEPASRRLASVGRGRLVMVLQEP
ncbi:hypothetical protein [Geothrix sp.]|uniref:hypothetical protein n=1 Tax=Geothrix sp. TaxID=1962974 RepID=UPI002607FE2B|nr:hypothetical protein [Geothrix sp.]WIL21420.1 MAG: hypothetical protein QOZ81_000681 [Geothrix sp.]